MAALRLLGNILSPAGRRGRLAILIYHRVLARPDPLLLGDVDSSTFDWQMALLADQFNVLPLAEACARLRNGDLPPRAAAVTFDDGYADNVTVALPILQRHGIRATFFIATAFLDGGRMWNDSVIEAFRRARGPHLDLSPLSLSSYSIGTEAERRSAVHKVIQKLKYLPPGERARRVEKLEAVVGAQLPTNLMMTRAQVRTLHGAGMGVGGHTHSHPILASLNPAAARQEIVQGKALLEEIVGDAVRLFAYPNGKPGTDYSERDVTLVRELGFDAAVSTAWGAAGKRSDAYQLPRFTPWDRTPLRFHLRLLRNYRHQAAVHQAPGSPSTTC